MVTGMAQWERGRLGGITGSVAVSTASVGARTPRDGWRDHPARGRRASGG